MKLRNGFVSNSSSSSFIITGPRKPTKAELMMLFGVIPETLSGRFMQQIVDIVLDAVDVKLADIRGMRLRDIERRLSAGEYVGIIYSRNYNGASWVQEALYVDSSLFIGTYGEWVIQHGSF
jgi:hypothetical protein